MFLSLNLNGLLYHMQFPGLYEPLNAISICSKSSKIEIFTRKCLGKTQMCFEKNAHLRRKKNDIRLKYWRRSNWSKVGSKIEKA